MKARALIKDLTQISADAEVIFIDNQGKRHKVDGAGWHGGENAELFLLENDSEFKENQK